MWVVYNIMLKCRSGRSSYNFFPRNVYAKKLYFQWCFERAEAHEIWYYVVLVWLFYKWILCFLCIKNIFFIKIIFSSIQWREFRKKRYHTPFSVHIFNVYSSFFFVIMFLSAWFDYGILGIFFGSCIINA